MGLLCCAAKCCGCIVLSQLLAILLPLALLAAAALSFKYYVMPWGEDEIRHALGLASDVDISALNASYIEANSCSGCVFGANTDWPTNTTGALHFLDSSAGSTASGAVAVSLAAGAAAGAASMLWASLLPSAATAMSTSSGFYEMTHIFEQAQYIGMISQLRLDGAPEFLLQFSKELAWTNFNIPKSSSDDDVVASAESAPVEPSAIVASSTGSQGSVSSDDDDDDSDDETTRRRRLSMVIAAQESGPARYAEMIGVSTEDLFWYTLMTFAIVLAAIHVLYLLGVLVVGALSKKESFSQIARKLYRKVIWAGVLALLLAQYIFSMAGFYYASKGSGAESASYKYYLGVALLALVVIFAVLFGVLVVGNNKDELRDVGTYEHDQRPFSAKYSAYYDEYNFENRFFFVPRILLAVSTGAVVGIVTDSTTQLLCILGITMLYLILLLVREPNLLRFLYYIGVTSVFLKVVLICMMLIVARDDYFPQSVRDSVAYGIVGVNMFIFLLLFLRQAYTIIHKMVVACRHKKNGGDANSNTDINLEVGNNSAGRNGPPHGYSRMESTPAYNQQQQYGNASHFNASNGYGHNPYAPQTKDDHNLQQKKQQEPIPMLELSSNANKPGPNYSSNSNYTSSNYGEGAHAGAAPTNNNFAAPSRNNQYNFDSSQGPTPERAGIAGAYATAPAQPKTDLSSSADKPGENFNYNRSNYGEGGYAGVAPSNNFAAPSRNNQYNFDSSQGPTSERAGAYAAAPAQPKPPTYDVLAAYLGTPNTQEEDAYSTSPQAGAAAARPSTRMSRISSRPKDVSRVSAFRDSSVYGNSFSGDESFVSALSTSAATAEHWQPSPQKLRAGSVDVDGLHNNDDVVSEPPMLGSTRKLRTGSVDVDDLDDSDDVVSEPPMLGSTSLAPGTSGSEAPSSGQPPSDRSFLAFTDSSVGSSSFDEGSPRGLGASLVASQGRTDPQLSIFSDKNSSFGGDDSDWFLRRSKTELEADSSDRDSYDVDSVSEQSEVASETGFEAGRASRPTVELAEAHPKVAGESAKHGEIGVGDNDSDSDSGSDVIMEAPRGTNESFMSARSTDDDINFYFSGDRSTQVLMTGQQQQQPPRASTTTQTQRL